MTIGHPLLPKHGSSHAGVAVHLRPHSRIHPTNHMWSPLARATSRQISPFGHGADRQQLSAALHAGATPCL